MCSSRFQQVENVLRSLVSARKAVQFYPPKNPRITEAVRQLVTAADALFPEESPDAGPGEEQDTEEGLFLQVAQDFFLLGEAQIGTRHEPVCKFAEELYRHGVKWLWLLPGACEAEFEQFLAATCRPADKGRDDTALLNGSDAITFEHIGIERADTLRLLEISQGMDMLDYLRQKQALRRPPGLDLVDEAPDIPGEEAEDISDLIEFFLDVAQGSEEKREYLFNTLTEPRRLAAFMTYISSIHPESESDKDGMSLDVFRQTLRHIADSVRSLPEDMRVKIVSNMAEAILTTDASTQEKVMQATLSEDLGAGGIEDEICASFPDERVADLLSAHVKLHRGTADTVSNFLEEFAGDPGRRDAIRGLVAQKLDQFDDHRLREVAELLKAKHVEPKSKPTAAALREKAAAERREQSREALARKVAITTGEAHELAQRIEVASKTSDVEQSALVTLCLYTEEHIEALSEKMMALLNTSLRDGLGEAHYEFIARFLELAMERTTSDKRAALREALQPFLAKASSRETIVNIIQTLQKSGPTTPQYKQIRKLLGLMGDEVAEVVFDRIVTEKVRATRQFMLALFLELGEGNVRFLSRNVEHRRWFVVRNVAYLLGQLGSEAGVDALERVLYHTDMRVRREVLRALAAIKGPRAEGLLTRCIDDREPAIRALAAEWLGILDARDVLPSFVDLLTRKHRKLRRQPAVAVGVVRAVGRLGGTEEIALLQKFAKRSRGFSIRKREDIGKACSEAVAMIEDRLERDRPRSQGT